MLAVKLVVHYFFSRIRIQLDKCFVDHEISLSTSVPSQNTFRR